MLYYDDAAQSIKCASIEELFEYTPNERLFIYIFFAVLNICILFVMIRWILDNYKWDKKLKTKKEDKRLGHNKKSAFK